jgi:predicted nucleotidyltransferase
VLVYGSLARGTAGAESDWDILVLTEKLLPSAEQDRIRDAVYGLQLEHDVVISLLFAPRDRWDDPLHRATPFHRNVQREGVLI